MLNETVLNPCLGPLSQPTLNHIRPTTVSALISKSPVLIRCESHAQRFRIAGDCSFTAEKSREIFRFRYFIYTAHTLNVRTGRREQTV